MPRNKKPFLVNVHEATRYVLHNLLRLVYTDLLLAVLANGFMKLDSVRVSESVAAAASPVQVQ